MSVKLNKIAAFVLCALIGIFGVFSAGNKAYAATYEPTIEYSNVLDDLSKDSSFKTTYYPENKTDYSLSVIQVAESSSKDIFVYVYQPSGQSKDLRATSINISTSSEIEISPKNYTLKFLNSYETLYKYKVSGLRVGSDPVRYYAIPSIYRKFDSTLGDKQASGGNTVDEVAFEVGRQWSFSVINGMPYSAVVDIQTIVVTNKFVGFVRYPNGYKLFSGVGACDSHFVAFTTDKKIDKLYEADVYYTTQALSYDFVTEEKPFNTVFGTKSSNYVSLKYTDQVEHSSSGFLSRTYTWDRIETIEDFISGESLQTIYSGAVIDVNVASKLADETLNNLKEQKWVLRFKETEYEKSPKSAMGAATYYHTESTMVGEVTILRLMFLTDGVNYNLGVIDNKQTGEKDSSGIPIPVSSDESIYIELTSTGQSLFSGASKILALIAIIALFMIVVLPLSPFIISGVIKLVTKSVDGFKSNLKKVKNGKKPKNKKKGKKKK